MNNLIKNILDFPLPSVLTLSKHQIDPTVPSKFVLREKWSYRVLYDFFIQRLPFHASKLTMTVGWTENFQLPKRDTPNKWTLFSDNRSKQASKKTWQLNHDEQMAEYFLTIQEPLILQRKPIPPSPHPACLLRVKEDWWEEKRASWEGSIRVVLY